MPGLKFVCLSVCVCVWGGGEQGVEARASYKLGVKF